MITNAEKQIIKDEISKDDIVFDVGFYTGEWSKEVFKNHECQIYAFEAQSNLTFPGGFLHRQFTLFDDTVISDSNDSVDFYVYIDQPYLSTLYKRNEKVNKEKMGGEKPNIFKKRSLTLDFICRKHDIKRIDFLKLDIEGAELNALMGANELLSQGKIDKIQIEFGECNKDSGNTLYDIIGYLQQFGFKRFLKMTDNDIIETTIFNENEIYCNYLCSK